MDSLLRNVLSLNSTLMITSILGYLGENMKIVIDSDLVITRSGVSSRTDKPYTMREQRMRVMSDYLRGPAVINLAENQQPYPPGEYDIDLEQSVSIGNFGSIQFVRDLVIKPLSSSKPLSFGKQ